MPEWLRLCLACIPLFVIPGIVGKAFWGCEVYWASRWWFGMILSGLLLIFGHGANLHGGVVTILFSVFFIFCAVKSFQRCKAAQPEISKDSSKRFEPGKIVAGILFFLLFCSYLDVLAHPLTAEHWDALSSWWNKVRALYFWPPFAETPCAGWDFMNYPYLGPMLELLIIRCTGGLSESFGRLLFPTVYFMWMMTFNLLFPGKIRWRTFWLIPFIAILFYDRRAFTSGYQDGFVGLICGMAAVHFVRFFLKENRLQGIDGRWDTDLFLGVFFAGAASFVKSEGTFLGVILAAAAAGVFLFSEPAGKIPRKILILLPYIIFFGILVCIWPGFLLLNHVNILRMQNAFVMSDLLGFYRNLDRWEMIRLFVAHSILKNWPVLSACLMLSLVSALAVPKLRRVLAFLWLAGIGHGIFVTFLYFVTRLNLQWHLVNSFGRLMFQHFFVYSCILYTTGHCLLDAWDRKGLSVSTERERSI